MQKSYNIKKTCQITGLNPNTLRTWERRYNIFEPVRSDTGRRLYSEDDIEKIKYVAQLVFEGHAISNLGGLNLEQLKQMILVTPQDKAPPEKIGTDTRLKENHISDILTQLIKHLEKFELKQITRLVEQCRYRLSPNDFITRIVVPLMTDIGQKVDQGYFSIAEEHACSAILKFELIKLLTELRIKEHEEASSVILSTPEGEFHEFGALCAAILFADQGWKVFYLGANLPCDALIHASKALLPSIIVISNLSPDQNKSKLSSDIRQILSQCPESELWIGGKINSNMSDFKSETRLSLINNFETLQSKISGFKS